MAVSLVAGTGHPLFAAEDPVTAFHAGIERILEDNCYDCHGGGVRKGKVTLDAFASDADLLERRDLWLAVLKNVRAGVMPPADEPRPDPADVARLVDWIKYGALGLNRDQPDPGRVTLRRLNRIEYGNTIRDLMGVEFRGDVEFPPDDTGHGFDNIGDVLSVSPLLLEKYLHAADTIVREAVPTTSRVVQERVARAIDLRPDEPEIRYVALPFKETRTLTHAFAVDRAASYQVKVEFDVKGPFDFDPARCALVVRVNDVAVARDEYVWHETKRFTLVFDMALQPGNHRVTLETEPLVPAGTPIESGDAEEESTPGTQFRVVALGLNGPLDRAHWVQPENYARFFPDGPPPSEPAARDRYARACLEQFATRAFRRPPDAAHVDRLAALARATCTQPGQSFESGMARAIMAVLASPRFVFRVEGTEPATTPAESAPVDEYALATRLAYFLWSTMPDEPLFALAARGELRRRLPEQIERMLNDERALQFIRNFTGQWLQARDVEFVPINARAVLGIRGRGRVNGRRVELDAEMRKAMRRETELLFERIMLEDRSVLELIDSDYTYLNEALATHYAIPGVKGKDMRLVTLPADSPRGGVLTQGTVLTVTSNPTRTSPVKRGLFILENILGTPPPPPPATVPDLEEAKKAFADHEPSLREQLEQHRRDPLCSSCHSRMDPLGFALENFNALGMWREQDANQPIDAAGQLITGEKFQDIREVKRIIVTDRRRDFYRCLTEKLLTYAIGRGLEYHDVETVDRIVDELDHTDGRFSTLLHGIIASAPFQRTRTITSASSLAALASPAAHAP